MAATAGSPYQAILLKHIANNPPNAYPQTSFETFKQYQIRMASQGLNPDIGATESDSDYLTRLASYLPVINTDVIKANKISVGSSYVNSYNTSITASNADDGRFINMITGSLVYLTGSLSSTFTTLIYQSGSAQITITGSDSSVVLRNRQSLKAIAGQFGIASVVRLPNGDFALSGDLA